ncbi:PadR family transcriptional regulator, partial [Pseudomonas sp. MWU13-2860]
MHHPLGTLLRQLSGRNAHHRLHAMARHGHGGAHGRHGGFGGFGGGDDENLTRGRKFSSDELQLLLLALLEQQPSHGYELIKALQSRSNGFYSPSPGMVYPALTYLEELGRISVSEEGKRKCYALTAAGRDYLEQNREQVEWMMARLQHIARKMNSIRRALTGEMPPPDDAAGSWIPELTRARGELKQALMRTANVDEDEQRRIAAIL